MGVQEAKKANIRVSKSKNFSSENTPLLFTFTPLDRVLDRAGKCSALIPWVESFIEHFRAAGSNIWLSEEGK